MTTAKILVIDDEPSIVNLVTAYLGKEGYDVRRLRMGRRAYSRRAPSSPT